MKTRSFIPGHKPVDLCHRHSLNNLQKEIFGALLHGQALSAGLVKGCVGRSVLESLAIYRNNSKISLTNALRGTYEVCVKIVGDDFFNAMAAIYIDQTPSRYHNINQYGETFSDFIASFPPVQSLPYLSDVAHLEWVWSKALYSEDLRPFDFNILGSLSVDDQASIVFKLPPSAHLVVSQYPIQDIWMLNQGNSEEIVDLDKGGVKLFIWRKDMHVQMEVLTEVEWLVLEAIQAQVPLSKLGEVLLGEGQENLPEMLSSFIERGWVAGFNVPSLVCGRRWLEEPDEGV